jgi:hypothetical protein
MEWSKEHSLIDHFVYLALTDRVKVGVTRHTQVPTRWIDQGAWKIIKLAKTPYRQLAGLIEVELKKHLTDKTSWQKMLKNELAKDVDLKEEKYRASGFLSDEYKKYVIDDQTITEIEYPVNNYPKKIKSISLDKSDEFEGKLTGIKGQYLIFEDQSNESGTSKVFNVRKHNGYLAELEIE